MTTEDHAAGLQQPKLDAEAVTLKVLELIRSSKDINDFTEKRISEVTGLMMIPYSPTRFGASDVLTPEWGYAIEMNKSTVHGPQFMFRFDVNAPSQTPPATDICKIDFDRFSSELERMGFKKQTRYGEHGRIVNYQFDKDGLRVGVGTEGEDNDPPEKIKHQCLRSVIVN